MDGNRPTVARRSSRFAGRPLTLARRAHHDAGANVNARANASRPRIRNLTGALVLVLLAGCTPLKWSRQMGGTIFRDRVEVADVAVAPGVGYGEDGEGFVRIALVENEQRLRQAARNVKRYLQSMGVNASAA